MQLPPSPQSVDEAIVVAATRTGVPVPRDGDSFLVSSGDSLRATQFAVELERLTGLAVGLSDLAETHGSEALSRRLLDAHAPRPAETSVVRTGDAHERHRNKLSFAQERMAFMQGLAAGSAAYHVAFGLRIRGSLDARALTQAIARLPAHFEVLRTCFVAVAEGTVHLPAASNGMPVRIIEERRASTTRLHEIASEFCNAPFDLERGDTGRALLIRSDPADHLLVLVFHHIVIDQWSYELLLTRLANDYSRLAAGEAPESPARDIYLEYTAWHRHWFREHAYRRELAYWEAQLGDSTRTTFEPDRQRPPTPSYRGDRVPVTLLEEQWLALESLARAHDVSLAMLLFAASVVLLRNHCGCDDVTVGLAVANRNHHRAAQAFGTLVNTLAIRIRIDETLDFAALLGQVRARFLEAYAHQDMPFEILVKQLETARNPSVSPLFGVLFNMLNTPPAEFALGGARVERVEVDRKAAQFDLTLTVDRFHTRTLWLEYATDLYGRQTIERIAERFYELLRAIPMMMYSPVARLPRHTRAEDAQTRVWGQGAPLRERRFELRGRSPDQVVVICDEQTLTFRELDEQAARFAAGLMQLGLAAGDRIGLLISRSVALPVALVGALRAGVAFVPLDAAFPAERLAFVVRDAGLRVVVTDVGQPRPDWLPADVRTVVQTQVVATATADQHAGEIDEACAAYVLYTSGSSGLPKGVEVPRRALFNFLASMRSVPGIAAGDRLLAVTTVSFDIALLELLLPLTAGATVIIARRDQAADAVALIDLMKRHSITLLQATPTTWLQLLDAGWPGSPQLRALIGGEALPPELARRLLPRVAEVWNMYGPTETTIWSTCFRVQSVNGGPVPVGRPIANTVVAVVDAADRPAGVGIVGEIVIGGDGVASGYVGLPELTAARFPSLHALNESLTWYRTGDLGRWNPEGQLECLGRLDAQVKIRGFRIEPGEIEATAAEVPGVTNAVVVATQAGTSDARLLSYLVVDRSADNVIERVRARLRARLPDYMQPQAIRILEALPTLPNGKIDRNTLARMETIPPTDPANPPNTPMERALHELWCDLLELASVGRDMDFFEIGGHSLLAMRLVTRIKDDLGKQCSLAQVFQNPTLAQLARTLESARAADLRPLVPLRAEGDGTPLFCICGIRLYRPLTLQLPPGFPVLAVHVPYERHRLDTIGLARRYVEVIRSQQARGPYRLLGFSFGGVLAFEIAQQIRAAGERVEMLVILDSDVPGTRKPSSLRRALSALRTAAGTAGRREAATPDYIVAMRDYKPATYDGRLLFVRALRAEQHDAGLEWSDLATDAATAEIDADHLGLLAQPAVEPLAQLVADELARATRNSSTAG